MLEGLAAWVLNNYLGQYFENLHTDQLSIGLLNGEVELENLPLRKDALKKFKLPLQVESGFVGKVRLEIPVTRLRSEPWIVMFEQLYLVVTPLNLTEYDEEAENYASYASKMYHLNSIESAWRSRVIGPEADQYESSYLKWASYGTSFISHILENIQLKVKDVHIRYEDSQTLPDKAFAFGIKIDSLLLQSSDEHWIPKFIYLSGKDISYKLLELKNLVVYMDNSGNLFSQKSLAELAAVMHPVAYERNAEYIVEPMNCMARLKKNLSSSPLKSRSTPRFICDLKVEDFLLTLTNYQCELLFSTIKLYERLEIARAYRKWRPKCVVAGNARKWWKFAMDCMRDKIRLQYQNRNWPFVLQRARDLCNYVDIYCDYLVTPISLDEETQNFKLTIEEELPFESLKYIRDFCMEKVTENVQKCSLRRELSTKSEEENVGKGLLQSWFPTWGGWYTGSEETETDLDSLVDEELHSPSIFSPQKSVSTALEEEILYVISDSLDNSTYLKRDAVFCHISFFLQRCTVSLCQNVKPKNLSPKSINSSSLFQLEFANVRSALEWRPRNQAYKCDLELGSMSLKDHSTKNTAFPLLIASNQRESLLGAQKTGMPKATSMYERLSSFISTVSRLSQDSNLDKANGADSLLSLVYEKKPRNSKFENKLVIRSQSVDVIYNRQAFESIWHFFSKFNLTDGNQEALALTEAANKRYEQIKQQTKNELKRNWDAMFENSLNSKKTKWDIQLDISAPQIIFPEHFQDVNATVVVVDLGKLVFSTSSLKSDQTNVSENTYESDNDTFATPCSTPEELLVKEELCRKSSQADSLDGSLSETNIHDHLYDKYDLKLCDIQVLVVKVKDNWKFACAKGTGTTHVVERFSINLHLEKRLFTILPECASITDYQWPHFALSGTLPHLTFHINENKVQALKNLFLALTSRSGSDQSSNTHSMQDNEVLMTKSNTMTEFGAEPTNRAGESELIIMQFAVDKLSVQLQSRGISIAELHVTGVRTKVSKRPSDTTALLTVHSLLLVDALQTFGPDFELLIASHKHIGMDSVSGKLLDSDHCSPVSPSSPDPNLGASNNTSFHALNQALSSLASNRAQSPVSDKSAAWSPPFVVSPTFAQQFAGYDERDSEALISLEVVHLHEPTLSDDASQYIVSIQFNSLDIIANQETVVELVGFFHQIFSSIAEPTFNGGASPQSTMKPTKSDQQIGQYGSLTSIFEDAHTTNTPKINVMFDFHKLTVLLLRGVAKEAITVGRKVATAVISDAKIDLSVESDLLTVEGSLGGFQIRDVTPDVNKHQCLISMGHDPIVESSQAFRSHNGVYQPMAEMIKRYNKAFSFKVIRPLVLSSRYDLDATSLNASNELTIELRLASVCYAHSPQFLLELKSCAKEFKQYMIKVAGSIKQAATEMAMGLVSKRIETFANLTSGSREGTLRRQRTMSLSRSTDTLHFPNPPPASTLESQALSPIHTLDPDLSFNVKLDVVLETPIIVLPEAPNSASVLVAHLGQISLRNHTKAVPPIPQDDELLDAYPIRMAEFEMKIREISLYSLNVEDRLKTKDGQFSPWTTTLIYAEELYSCQKHGSPILHNTGMDLILTHQKSSSLLTEYESGLFFPMDVYFDQPQSEFRDSYQVEGRVVTPLKLTVARNQYHQIMKTLDNIYAHQLNEAPKQSSHHKLDPIHEVSQRENMHQEASFGANMAKKSSKNFKPLKGKFVVPKLCVELIGDEGKPLVDFILQDIVATYDAKEPYKSDTQISLNSLTMEDMQLHGHDAMHRFLMKSELVPEVVADEGRCYPKFVSSSCPQLGIDSMSQFLSSSMPSKLEMEQPFGPNSNFGIPVKRGFGLDNLRHKDDSVHSSRLCNASSPYTPPPSPANFENVEHLRKDALMTITLQDIDERHPDFVAKYDETNRFIDIDFNNLTSVINIESWVMVLDFFKGIDDVSDIHSSDKYESSTVPNYSSAREANIVMEVKVNSLTIVFNEQHEELARASVNHVCVRSVGSAGNINLTGRLGSLSLLDSTKDGQLYRNKFLTTGREAITFQLFRYNSEDPELLRDCDIRLKLIMSSIMYIHSQKFTMRLVQFCNDFIALRDYVSDWRLVNAGVQVSERKHGTRASLNISADAPIICIPMSSHSEKVLVLDLGSFSVSNKFYFAGEASTISEVRRESLKDHPPLYGGSSDKSSSVRSRSRSNKRLRKISGGESQKPQLTNCLLDVMQMLLAKMDLLVGIRRNCDLSSKVREAPVWKFGYFVISRKGPSLLKEKCAMKIQVERNLDGDKSKIVPDFSIRGLLTRVHASVNTFTYKLIKGLLSYNLGEGPPEPRSSPLLSSFLNKPKAPVEMPTDSELWTTLSIELELENVTLEVDNSLIEDGSSNGNNFAKVDFINSRLSFKTCSNGSREIDLASNEILLTDIQSNSSSNTLSANVFTEILLPVKDEVLRENSLQAEVHYRSNTHGETYKILLNKMRLMVILEWWKDALAFMQASFPNPKEKSKSDEKYSFTVSDTTVERPASQGYYTPRLNPVVESTGLMTRNSLISEDSQPTFEVNFNIIDSDVIIVENSSIKDSPALILKTTAILTYQPESRGQPVTCSLNHCELYSCVLGDEEQTSLSIVDPVNVFIVVSDVSKKALLGDISNIVYKHQHVVEISLQQLNIRLSYHDMKMFKGILESIPEQTEQARLRKGSTNASKIKAEVEKLLELGFSSEDCQKALKERVNLDEAAIWLTQNAFPRQHHKDRSDGTGDKTEVINIQSFELRTESVNLCIIDDCGDCDVPLLEASFSRLELNQDVNGKGSAACKMAVDYYNRALSGWEPFIEPWRCNLTWHRRMLKFGQYKTDFHLISDGVVDITVTPTLIDLLNIVNRNWTEDFYNKERNDPSLCNGEEHDAPKMSRKRTPFVPFSIKNDTGCLMSFFPLEHKKSFENASGYLNSISEEAWMDLQNGETISFSFHNKGKQRHGNTHQLNAHKIAVRVNGMQAVGPISIDKVGVYFRLTRTSKEFANKMPIAFAITMDGVARKLITIRSALLLKNILPYSVDLKMANTHLNIGSISNVIIPSMSTISIPLMYTWAKLYIRPFLPSNFFKGEYVPCTEAVNWKKISQNQDGCSCQSMFCNAIITTKSPLRFFVYVRNDPPLRTDNRNVISNDQSMLHPGYSIVIVSQITLVNLLPSDLHYEMNSTNKDSGMIKPGEHGYVSTDTSDDTAEFEIRFWTDHFRSQSNISIRPASCPYSIRLKLQDGNDRQVFIQVHAEQHQGRAIKISVCAHYWLINKTALPLVFKQDGANIDAAGQEREHEIARCTMPLMFSFSDQDATPTLVVRVGKQYHSETIPQFCKMILLTQGTLVRRLIVCAKDQRPDFLYIIGIDVRPGRGRYSRTHMVIFSPRFHIENNSSHKLLLSQKYFASFGLHDHRFNWLRATPGCSLPFHWPRLDMEPLLVVRIEDVPDCLWSGGFLIEQASSFNLNIRNSSGVSFFLHVEILLVDATFFTVITDADFLPPPFRIDNYSEVPITYYQTGTREAVLRSIVKPQSSVPYAWDESTLPPYITCVAPGGTTATYSLNGREKAHLDYENFIYIAFAGTFPKPETKETSGSFGRTTKGALRNPSAEDLHSASLEFLQLVLDVVDGSRVSLNRKQPSCRSQLWRMTASGMLHHEGSSPPFDPNSKRPQSHTNILVLDIAGSAPLPDEYTSLMLRKPDPRRKLTQTWCFTDDGRLCCQLPNLYVQAKDGFMGLQSGNEAVLGPPQKAHYGWTENNVPLEQAIYRQRLRPGSGRLSVEVVADGPTRVLQITDVRNKKFPQILQTHRGEVVSMRDCDPNQYSLTNTVLSDNKYSSSEDYQLQMTLHHGIGLSLISAREELFYASFNEIVLEYVSTASHQTLDFSIRDIQVDNQLWNNQCQVVLYVTPHNKNDDSRHMPALHFSAHRLYSPPHLNAYIFKNLLVKLKNMTLTIEEEMLCKFLSFCGYNQTDMELERTDEDQYDTRKMLVMATSSNATRYYFSHLKIALDQVKLSVLTCKSLTSDLRNIRRKLGLTLVQFENAVISLNPFMRLHPFETWKFLVDRVKNHYEMELRSQAITILGSVDFLGNPIGFLSDVSEGVQEFVLEGSVRGLFLNVAHGMANSTAKMAESLSNVIGRATMDKKHEATRQKFASRQYDSGSDHLLSGVKGLGLGLYGGLTSVVTQTYSGAATEGIPGLFSGFAKGVIGTVTKPTSGILDLAIGTASAVRDTSKKPSLKPPSKVRQPRVVTGINGVTPRFNTNDALGQQIFHLMSSSPGEIFHSYDLILKDIDLQKADKELKMIISSTSVYFFHKSSSSDSPNIVLLQSLSEIHLCRSIKMGDKPYIELIVNSTDQSTAAVRPTTRSPKVQCDSFEIAEKVSKQINLVKSLYEELKYTVHEE